MTTRSCGFALAAMMGLTAGAHGEESLRTTQGVACAPDGASCTRFQGYVYVRRATEAAPQAPSLSGASAAGFSERRVYLNMGAAEAR